MRGLRRRGLKDLADATVVVTGASSGIGRATARAFAAEGANVVLAARDAGTLAEAASECERAGGTALPVVADVGDEAAVAELARRAVERFGAIDVWVNNAGVILYGHFEQTPADAFRRVIETNLFGEINGSRVALEQFRRQRRGVLVNVASLWARVTSPYVTAYVTSKFAVRAFSECLRQGLHDLDGSDQIHICTVLPESIDTPIFRHAGNYVGREVRAVPPIAAPERVARTILRVVRHPRREVTVGWTGHLLEFGHWLMPETVFSWMVPYVFDLVAIGSRPVPTGPGNVLAPMPALNAVDGGGRNQAARRAAAVAGAGALVLAPAAVAAARAGRRLSR